MATSRIEISRSAFEHNYKFIRNLVGDKVTFSSVVKGNAYGHGLEQFVPMAEACGVRHFSVFSANEALRVFQNVSDQCTIMIMGYIDKESMAWAIENEIEFYVFDNQRLRQVIDTAKKVKKPARVHFELETGMNRTGYLSRELETARDLVRDNRSLIELKGLCTHYAGAESVANYYRIVKQKKKFDRTAKKFDANGIKPELLHTACSAASLRYPKTHMDMVRIGIIQYGFFPSPETMIEYLNKKKTHDYPLRRLISWKSTIMDTKPVKAGEYIGYGTSYLASKNMKVAIVPVGYAHGFSRDLSNQGRVLIHGQRVTVVGMVNMNMMIIDVTNVEDVNKGDEVVLIGRQGDLEISVASFAEYSRQVNYEMLVRLPHDIPRSVVD